MKKISKNLLDKKYFIFDVDGTLIDSMGMWNRVDQEIIYNHTGKKVDLMEIKAFRDTVIYSYENVQGNIYLIYYAELIKKYGLDMSVAEYDYERSIASGYVSRNILDYKTGADNFVKILKGLGKKIGVATTTTRGQYDIYENQNQTLIRKAPLRDLVDVKVLCEDVERKKPDPEAYLKVIECFGCFPEECIVFEDSLNGVRAGKRAGIEVVSVHDESSLDEIEEIEKLADYKVDSFDELIELLGLNEDLDKE